MTPANTPVIAADARSRSRALAVQYILRVADSSLIHGQRLAQWCGHAPVLEEDIALTNIALDHTLMGTSPQVMTSAVTIMPSPMPMRGRRCSTIRPVTRGSTQTRCYARSNSNPP